MIYTNLNTYPGSLISDNKNIISSFDIDKGEQYRNIEGFALQNTPLIKDKTFKIEDPKTRSINIINGFGVTIGDSIIGLTVCHYLKEKLKKERINIVRPCRTDESTESVYTLAKKVGLIDTITSMPYSLSECNKFDFNVDMGNQLFRADFQTMEMHDYFFKNIGLDYKSIPLHYKKNSWLERIENKININRNYVLFCPESSTPLRRIPYIHHEKIVKKLIDLHRVEVLGFSPLIHDSYTDITKEVNSLYDFINIIRNSIYVYTSDSSALHIAAAYDIPSHCIFTSIDPALRVKYYKYCTSSYIGDKITEGIHFTKNEKTITHVEHLFEKHYEKNIF